MIFMPTPHNSAEKGDYASTVLMPGDPLRAQFIAEKYLDDAECVNKVRGMLGFTGYYKGTRLSVQSSGMGMPSMGIYSHELFEIYDVQNIIRIGTAGAIAGKVGLREMIIAVSCSTNSSYALQYGLPGTYAPTASWKLLSAAVKAAEEHGGAFHVGNILTSDAFYDDAGSLSVWQKMNVLALYMNAARSGRDALTILTVSDCPLRGLETTAEERQTTFIDMIETALETAAAVEKI